MNSGKKTIIILVIAIVFICLLFHGCCTIVLGTLFDIMEVPEEEQIKAHRPETVFGLTTADYQVVDEGGLYGGCLGDGEYYLIMDCSKNPKSARNVIWKWEPLPLSDNLKRLMYGQGYHYATNAHLPFIEHGFYRFRDDFPDAENTLDDTELFDRYSINCTLAVYDTDNEILYYFETDS